jgi:outer membrane protein
MKKVIRSIPGIVFILFFLGNTVWAANCNIAVIDYQRCLQESNEGKKVFADLQIKHASLKKQLEAKQSELLALQKEIETQGRVLNSEAKADKQKDFERKGRELEYLIQDLTDEMKEAEFTANKRIENDIQEIINKIAREDNLDLVREKNSTAQDIWFVSEKIDITDRVIKELNKLKP